MTYCKELLCWGHLSGASGMRRLYGVSVRGISAWGPTVGYLLKGPALWGLLYGPIAGRLL